MNKTILNVIHRANAGEQRLEALKYQQDDKYKDMAKPHDFSVIVNTGDVTLENMVIKGNLYITEGVGEGNVTLSGVVVKGKIFIKGRVFVYQPVLFQ